MPRPLVPTSTTRLHHQTRHRVLELERRQAQPLPAFDFMVVASSLTDSGAGESGRWYVVQSGCKLVGLVAALADAAVGTTTGTVAVNGSTVVTATIPAGSTRSTVWVAAVPLGPDDYLTFGCSASVRFTLHGLLTGRGAYSGGLAMYPL